MSATNCMGRCRTLLNSYFNDSCLIILLLKCPHPYSVSRLCNMSDSPTSVPFFYYFFFPDSESDLMPEWVHLHHTQSLSLLSDIDPAHAEEGGPYISLLLQRVTSETYNLPQVKLSWIKKPEA